MINLLSILLNWLSGRWGYIAVIGSSMIVLYKNILGIIDAAKSAIALLDGLTASGTGILGTHTTSSGLVVAGIPIFSTINHLIPLDLAIAMFYLWLPLLILCATIRSIKAWIPTIS